MPRSLKSFSMSLSLSSSSRVCSSISVCICKVEQEYECCTTPQIHIASYTVKDLLTEESSSDAVLESFLYFVCCALCNTLAGCRRITVLRLLKRKKNT